MDYLYNYLSFLGEIATVVVSILVIFAGLTAMSGKSKQHGKGKLSIKKLNEQFDKTRELMQQHTLNKKATKELKKATKKKQKSEQATTTKPSLFVLRFNGDIKATAVSALSQEITAILLTAKSNDEVLVCLESGGGVVNGYGLAASQLQRIKDANIKLYVAVDKVAASGGYMMACVANHILAAPFSIIGSIGVIAQLPNFHRFLEKKDIDFEQITAGEYKRTLTMLGKNTDKGRQKMQEDIDETHTLFKQFIKKHREHLNIDAVATGEHWYGVDALAHKLIDEITTSDDFILQKRDQYEIYHIEYKTKQSLSKKISSGVTSTLERVFYHGS